MKNKKNLPDINNLKFSLNYWFKKILKSLDVNSNTIHVLHSLLAMSLFDLFVCFYFCFVLCFFWVFLWYLSLIFEIFVFVIRYQIQNNLSSLYNKNMRLFERLLPFVEFKKREKYPWWSVTFWKVAGWSFKYTCIDWNLLYCSFNWMICWSRVINYQIVNTFFEIRGNPVWQLQLFPPRVFQKAVLK